MRIAILCPQKRSFETFVVQNSHQNNAFSGPRVFEGSRGLGETHRGQVTRDNQSGQGFLFPEERHAMDLYRGLLRSDIDVSLFPIVHNSFRGNVSGEPTNEDVFLGREPISISDIITTAGLFKTCQDFDLIHSHANYLPLAYAGIVETPLLATIHQPTEPEALPLFQSSHFNTCYVSTSNSRRTDQINYAATIYNGIDVNTHPLRSRDPKETLLFVGKLTSENGVEEALEIARLAGSRLILAGTIEDPGYVQSLISSSPCVTEIVDFLAVDETLRLSLYCRADALLLPRGLRYPFTYAVLEALACGTPVISKRDDFLQEILTEGVNACWFESTGEAFSALRKMRSLSPEDCRASIADRFSLDQMVGDYVKLYKKIQVAHAKDERRPWGYFEVLSEKADHKVKRISVYPRKRLSLQKHRFRSEHWFMVSGCGEVTLDNQVIRLLPGQCLQIPLGAKHRMANTGEEMAVFIEVQTGSNFCEDDIERFEDDFGRIEH